MKVGVRVLRLQMAFWYFFCWMFGKHGVHEVSCSAHVFAQKQHVRRTFVRTFTTHPNPGPTPPHSRLSHPELLHFHLHCTSSTCFRLHTIDLLNTPVRRPSLSLLAMIHPKPVVIEFGSKSAWQWPSLHPSRKTVVIEFVSESAVQSILHRNPVDIEFGSPAHWQPAGESMIHRNPVLVEFGSESAAQSIIHRKTVVIEFGSESAAQSILPGPGHSQSPTSFEYRNSDAIHFGSPERPRPSVSKAQPICH